MLSWEYPPALVGGLGRHVHALATSLATAGHAVTVVTRQAPGAPADEVADGVRVVRATPDPVGLPMDPANLLPWALAFNHALTRAALGAGGGHDVVHAHDWLVAHAAMTVHEAAGTPLVATIHATEAGRHQGHLPHPHNRTIDGVERWLSASAARVIVCSDYMRAEVSRQFDVPADGIDVVANGVEALRWQARPRAVAAARARFAPAGAPLVSFAGRLVYEKGVQHAVAAVPRLRLRHPGLRLVVAGDGPHRAALQAQAAELGVADAVDFTGFLGGHDLPALMAASDCYVVPSIYEPFGMVALEAAAAGTPVAVAATGGLAEIVEPGGTGVQFPPGDPDGLADAVSSLLLDTDYARALARRARRRVRDEFNWPAIAARTAAVYAAAAGPAPQARPAESPAQPPAEPAGRPGRLQEAGRA
nr:glycosyltransferase family 4 protein [Spirilliplanes yamanashiensis]